MVRSLLLKLSGPLQSWGEEGRYRQRTTQAVPTKSGVLGLLAAALGRERGDDLSDLAALRFAVRVDQPGTLLRDFQTAHRPGESTGPIVQRYYLTDAVFVAAVESSDHEFLKQICDALVRPRFPLFLGRRSCPAPGDLLLGLRSASLVDALRSEDWKASEVYRKSQPQHVALPIYRDAGDGESGDPHQDVPISFAQEHRRYGWRKVVEDKNPAVIQNPLGGSGDPFMEAVMNA